MKAPAANKYSARVPLVIGAITGILVFDWTAIATLKSAGYTDEQLQNLPSLPPGDLAAILAAGFQKENPELTADKILSASPPLMVALKALDTALLFAYHGPETAENILESMDEIQKNLDAINKSPKKKQTK